MLYVISNPDTSAARQKAGELVLNLKKKRPDASVISLDHESATGAALDGLAATQGLFAPKIIVRIDLTDAIAEEVESVAKLAKSCADSANVFVISTGKLTAPNRTAFASCAEKLVVTEGAPKEKRDFPSGFAFSLGESKTRLFTEYHKELAKGADPEQLHGALFWRAKQMMGKGGAAPRQIARGLVDVYHRSRRGDGELRLLLEKFILSL